MQSYNTSSIENMGQGKIKKWLEARSNLSTSVSGVSATPIPIDEKEKAAANWLKADEFTAELAKKGQPITIADICKMHLILAEGLPNNGGTAGVLRLTDINCGDHFYVPGSKVEKKMNEFISWIQTNVEKMDAVELAALAYQRLVASIPFPMEMAVSLDL